MNGAAAAVVSPCHLLRQLENILDSDPLINEVGFVHPSQFTALNQDSQPLLTELKKPVDASAEFFWHGQHKLGISTHVLAPLYAAAKQAFMDALKQYTDDDEAADSSLETHLMKHSRALVLLSCDFGTAWNFRKRVLLKNHLLPMFMDELLLSNLVLSYSPKSERAWTQRRWVIKTMSRNYSDLQEIVEKESLLVKTIAENSKMNYRAWNHRCWLVPYMLDAQVVRELRNSRDWSGLHAADNSCFHYRALLLLRMEENIQQNHISDTLSCAEFHQIWKEELDWIGVLVRRYVGREFTAALDSSRKNGLKIAFGAKVAEHGLSKIYYAVFWSRGTYELLDVSNFVKEELTLFRSCMSVPDNEFGDYQAQATYAATYIMWLAKQMPLSFGAELKKDSEYDLLREMLSKAGKRCLWDSFARAMEE